MNDELTAKVVRLGAWTGAILGSAAVIGGIIAFIVVGVRLVDSIKEQGEATRSSTQAISKLNTEIVLLNLRMANVESNVSSVAEALKYPVGTRSRTEALEGAVDNEPK